MITSTELNELFDALAKAQGEFPTIPKNKKVDFTYQGKRTFYEYADLADIIEATKKILSKNGLAVTQLEQFENGVMVLVTILGHKSGQFIQSCRPMPNPVGMNDQAYGSKCTYARKYSYTAIIGAVSDSDDDGQIAARKPDADKPKSQAEQKTQPRAAQAAKPAAPRPDAVMDLGDRKRLYGIGSEHGYKHDDFNELAELLGHKSTKELTKKQVQFLIDNIEKISPQELKIKIKNAKKDEK